jgi:histidinol-phosphate/aromatic aminotransferase/cobyric acid decarboxylase-like protein
VLIVGPALNIYRDAALDSGAVVTTVMGEESGQFLPDPQKLLERSGEADLVFLANPNRITGKALPDAALSEAISVLSRKGRMVAIDEAFIEFSEGEGFIRKAAAHGKVIVMRSTACYYGLAGLELAWAVSSPEFVDILKAKERWGLNLLAIEAGRTALTDKTFRKLSSKSIAAEKRLLQNAARRMQGVRIYDSDTHVMLMHMPDHAAEIARTAEKLGLAVEACTETEGLDGSFIRFSVMKHEHNLKFIRLLARVCGEKAEAKSGAE